MLGRSPSHLWTSVAEDRGAGMVRGAAASGPGRVCLLDVLLPGTKVPTQRGAVNPRRPRECSQRRIETLLGKHLPCRIAHCVAVAPSFYPPGSRRCRHLASLGTARPASHADDPALSSRSRV
jgi:hypothetical protein